MTHIIFGFLIAVSFGFQNFAQATINPVVPKAQRLHLGFATTYYNSTENFTNSGYGNLGKGGSYQEFQNTLMADYDLSSMLRLTSAVNFNFVEASNSLGSNSNSYFDWVQLGAEAWFTPADIPTTFNFEATIPVFQPDYSGDAATASEGVYTTLFELAAQPKWRQFRAYLSGGFLYLMENRGGRMPWTVGLSYGLPTGRIEGGARGVQTLLEDSSSKEDRAKRTDLIVNGNAGSLRFFSVDPSYQELYVKTRWGMLPNLDLSTDAAYAINGEKYSKGFTIGVGIHWLTDSLFGGSSSSTSSNKDEVDDFQYNGDRYQESLFEQADPSTKKKKSTKRPTKKKGKVNQMLDDAEKALEQE